MHTTSRLGLQIPDGTDNVNLYPAVASQVAGVLDSALTVNKGFTETSASGSFAASVGQLVAANPSTTVNLPSPSAGALVGVYAKAAVTGSTAVLVSTPSGFIYGVGLGTTSTGFYLGTGRASVLLQSDGTSWEIISGQQDTGWQGFGFGTHISAYVGSFYAPSVRMIGSMVYFRGMILVAQAGYTGGATMLQLPSPSDASAPSLAPAAEVLILACYGVGSGSQAILPLNVTTGGIVQYNAGLSPGIGGQTICLDGINYALTT